MGSELGPVDLLLYILRKFFNLKIVKRRILLIVINLFRVE